MVRPPAIQRPSPQAALAIALTVIVFFSVLLYYRHLDRVESLLEYRSETCAKIGSVPAPPVSDPDAVACWVPNPESNPLSPSFFLVITYPNGKDAK